MVSRTIIVYGVFAVVFPPLVLIYGVFVFLVGFLSVKCPVSVVVFIDLAFLPFLRVSSCFVFVFVTSFVMASL